MGKVLKGTDVFNKSLARMRFFILFILFGAVTLNGGRAMDVFTFSMDEGEEKAAPIEENAKEYWASFDDLNYVSSEGELKTIYVSLLLSNEKAHDEFLNKKEIFQNVALVTIRQSEKSKLDMKKKLQENMNSFFSLGQVYDIKIFNK